MKTKRAAPYMRVSSGEQNTGAQERALREYVQRRGWKLQKIYRDQGLSGASSNRPALAVADPHIRMLVVLILETGMRSNREALNLKWEDIDLANDSVRIRESKTPGRHSDTASFRTMQGGVAPLA